MDDNNVEVLEAEEKRTDEGNGKNNKKKIQKPAPASVLMLVSAVLILLFRLTIRYISDRLGGYAGVALLEILIFLIPGYLYLRLTGFNKSSKTLGNELRINRIKAEHIFIIIAAAVFMMSVTLILDIIFRGVYSAGEGFSLYSTFSLSGIDAPYAFIFPVISFALLPAVCEEFMFRGVLFNSYAKHGWSCAVLTCSVFFALFAFDPSLIPSSIFVSVLLFFLLSVTNSLPVCMVVHFIYNIYGIFIRTNVSNYFLSSGNVVLLILIIVFFILLSGAALCAEFSRKFKNMAKNKEEPPELFEKSDFRKVIGQTVKNFWDPAVLIFFGLYIVFYAIDLIF